MIYILILAMGLAIVFAVLGIVQNALKYLGISILILAAILTLLLFVKNLIH